MVVRLKSTHASSLVLPISHGDVAEPPQALASSGETRTVSKNWRERDRATRSKCRPPVITRRCTLVPSFFSRIPRKCLVLQSDQLGARTRRQQSPSALLSVGRSATISLRFRVAAARSSTRTSFGARAKPPDWGRSFTADANAVQTSNVARLQLLQQGRARGAARARYEPAAFVSVWRSRPPVRRRSAAGPGAC